MTCTYTSLKYHTLSSYPSDTHRIGSAHTGLHEGYEFARELSSLLILLASRRGGYCGLTGLRVKSLGVVTSGSLVFAFNARISSDLFCLHTSPCPLPHVPKQQPPIVHSWRRRSFLKAVHGASSGHGTPYASPAHPAPHLAPSQLPSLAHSHQYPSPGLAGPPSMDKTPAPATTTQCSRRPHRKTRTGCRICKARKVKVNFHSPSLLFSSPYHDAHCVALVLSFPPT
jgi:hypothetical protein